jgi:hypothetical protein
LDGGYHIGRCWACEFQFKKFRLDDLDLSCTEALPSHFRTPVKNRVSAPMNGMMNPMTLPSAGSKMNSAWALQMRASTMEEPVRLIQTLTGAILGNGGWVLSRGANDSGLINMLFEFERQSCVDMYTVLIAVGLELSQLAHLRFTELCQCTRSHFEDCCDEIVSVDLEIHSFSVETSAVRHNASEAA